MNILLSSTIDRVACIVVRLVTLECTREVNNPLYHCRHCARDSQSVRDRGISKKDSTLRQPCE